MNHTLQNALIIALCSIGGILAGISSGIGLNPIMPQPKNLRVQLVLTVVGALLIFTAIMLMDKTTV